MVKAVVQEGSKFRVYEAEQYLGDPDYLIDTVQAPNRCRSDGERLDWFKQTLFARSLGEVEFV